ncbi:MAG: hydroxyisourate hydrolase [Pseudonocardiaceae bacterium]|nr:hydroxyisourate hydrolase [Pseudonocardiaceae bacterium]
MSVSTHVLDSTAGVPAQGVAVWLERRTADGWTSVARAKTDDDGRVRQLVDTHEAGDYRLTFDVGGYFDARGVPAFYPEVTVTFRITDPAGHHHVPLLLSPFAYSTYRGS